VRFRVADPREFAEEGSPCFDLIVHLAAVVGGRLTIESDLLKVATDLAINATFFNWIVKELPRPRKVLYFSSSAVYPVGEQTITHNGPLAEIVNDDSKPQGVFAQVANCDAVFEYYQPETSLRRGMEIVYEYQRSSGLLLF